VHLSTHSTASSGTPNEPSQTQAFIFPTRADPALWIISLTKWPCQASPGQASQSPGPFLLVWSCVPVLCSSKSAHIPHGGCLHTVPLSCRAECSVTGPRLLSVPQSSLAMVTQVSFQNDHLHHPTLLPCLCWLRTLKVSEQSHQGLVFWCPLPGQPSLLLSVQRSALLGSPVSFQGSFFSLLSGHLLAPPACPLAVI
jgi:hypothetical protein